MKQVEQAMIEDDSKILERKFSTFGRFHLVRLIVKILPNDVHQIVMEVAGSASLVLRIVAAFLTSEGQVLEITPEDDIPGAERMRVKAIIGSGSLNMNPAVVTVDIEQVSAQQTRVTIRGVAKEGLIKQHAGEKAARFVAQRIREGANE